MCRSVFYSDLAHLSQSCLSLSNLQESQGNFPDVMPLLIPLKPVYTMSFSFSNSPLCKMMLGTGSSPFATQAFGLFSYLWLVWLVSCDFSCMFPPQKKYIVGYI